MMHPVCTECKFEEKQWQRLDYYPSVCMATAIKNPVNGHVTAGLCRDKNNKGECTDFVQKDPINWTPFCITVLAILAFGILMAVSCR